MNPVSEYREAVATYIAESYAEPYDRDRHLAAGVVFEVAYAKYRKAMEV